eukprot:scaffold92751_cov28-Tisochrysis_lutea.AAC.4
MDLNYSTEHFEVGNYDLWELQERWWSAYEARLEQRRGSLAQRCSRCRRCRRDHLSAFTEGREAGRIARSREGLQLFLPPVAVVEHARWQRRRWRRPRMPALSGAPKVTAVWASTWQPRLGR